MRFGDASVQGRKMGCASYLTVTQGIGLKALVNK